MLRTTSFSTGLLLISLLALSACSQTENSQDSSSASSQGNQTKDSFERFNRSIFRMNVGLDKHIIKPVAVAYKKVTPEVVDSGITNFFLNLEDVGNAINSLLQFKPGHALVGTERFLFNSSFGLAGVFDVATKIGLQKHEEDFGQTLAHWGVKSGPYVMLPFFGPSTLRDASAKLTVDRLTNPTSYVDTNEALAAFFLKNLDKRADVLSTEDAFKDISDDRYIAIRDAWLQRRNYQITDGKTNEKEESDLIDELEDLDAL